LCRLLILLVLRPIVLHLLIARRERL